MLNLKGPFGSEIEAHFSVTGRIDVAVKRVLEISNEGAILRTWRASVSLSLEGVFSGNTPLGFAQLSLDKTPDR